MPAEARTCVLYLAHALDDDVLAGWDQLVRDCSASRLEPVFVYDNTRDDFTERSNLPRDGVYCFTAAGLGQRFTVHVYDPRRPLDQGNAILGSLAFAQDRPRYDAYWRIEYDVAYDGCWHDLFAAFAANEADLLTTTLYRPAVRPDWGWWDTLRAPGPGEPPAKLRAFLPVARLSARACRTLREAYAAGWAGHDEVSVSSILMAHGLSIEDLGGDGAFVPAGSLNRYYTNTPAARGLAPGTFVCPPHRPTLHRERGKLYHPVKDRIAWTEAAALARASAPAP